MIFRGTHGFFRLFVNNSSILAATWVNLEVPYRQLYDGSTDMQIADIDPLNHVENDIGTRKKFTKNGPTSNLVNFITYQRWVPSYGPFESAGFALSEPRFRKNEKPINAEIMRFQKCLDCACVNAHVPPCVGPWLR